VYSAEDRAIYNYNLISLIVTSRIAYFS